MNTSTLFTTLICCAFLSPLSWGKAIDNYPKPALVTDTNHDSVLTLETVKKGQDLILIKPNPAKLTTDDIVFQTKHYNLYTSASWNDLLNPNALKNLLLAKLSNDGTIKVYTLANLGYANIQTVQNNVGNTEIYLLTQKGKMDKVVQIKYKAPPFHIYDPASEIKIKSS